MAIAKRPIHFGNVVTGKLSNLNALLKVRERVTPFTEQSNFIATNIRRINAIKDKASKVTE